MLEKEIKRLKRKARVKASISSSDKPKLIVYRSNSFIYAQIIDNAGKVICHASDLKSKGKLTKTESAKTVWEDIAKKATEKKVKEVVFDRNWFSYHGRVKALAEGARGSWLKF